MFNLPEVEEEKEQSPQLRMLKQRWQSAMDAINPFMLPRWISLLFAFCIYVARVVSLQGFHVVSYALGIFLLNQLVQFLSPKIDPEFEPDEDPLLPTSSGEFRPFIRRLPEFHFWRTCMAAILVSIFCTLFPFLDLPVFWPILVMYFVILFYATMKRQIDHMIRYRYVPFTYGKPKHQGTKSAL